MGVLASQITSLTIVYSNVYSAVDQRKHQSSASLAFVLGIQRWPVNSPHKRPVTRKMFPFDDVIMKKWFATELVISQYRGQLYIYICIHIYAFHWGVIKINLLYWCQHTDVNIASHRSVKTRNWSTIIWLVSIQLLEQTIWDWTISAWYLWTFREIIFCCVDIK